MMYRSSCYLSKPSILNSRCRFVSSKTRNILQNDILKNHPGRFTSSAPKSNTSSIKNKLYWGLSFVTIAVGGTSLVILSKNNDEFREAVENAIPFSKFAFDALISVKEINSILGEKDSKEDSPLTPLHSDLVSESADQINPTEDSDRLVVNVMDQPYVSQIDLEVGHIRSTEQMEEQEEGEVTPMEGDDSDDRLVVNVEDSPDVSQIDLDPEVENSTTVQMDEAEEVTPTPMEGDNGSDALVINVMDSPDVSQIDQDLEDESSATVQMEEAVEVTHTPVAGDRSDRLVVNVMDSPYVSQIDFEVGNSVVEEAVPRVLSKEELEVDLVNSHGNLEIILNDAVTSKKLAADLLQSYIIQFGQALLVPKSDPAYESICKATALLEQEVQENIDLAKSKESKVDDQIKSIVDLISVVRKSGFSDVADKSEEFIVDCHESLTVGDSDIELASNKLDFLLHFERRVEGSKEKLQEYLEDFTPDFLLLLNSQHYIDFQDVSNEDALLALSLERSRMILEEGHKKQIEHKKQLEEALLLQKEDLSREAEENLKIEIELLETRKENEMKSKIDELNDLHLNNLRDEIKALSEVHQNKLKYELSQQEAALNAQHGEEIERKLSEREDAHNLVIEKNMSYLKGIQSKITDVTDLDHHQRRNQHLWVAAQALNAALDNSLVNGRTKSLKSELSTLLQYGKDDEILENIIASVSETAVTKGVIPESDLLERFKGVKRVCKRVANVEEGGSILSYTLSFIKSFFVMSWYYRRYPEEDINIDNIIPYEVLEKADYFIKKRDLLQAAKLMSQLQGVSRKLSSDWLNEVRLLLETKQTAKFLMAYAGSLIAGFE